MSKSASIHATSTLLTPAGTGNYEHLFLTMDPRPLRSHSVLPRVTAQIRGIARAHRLSAHDVEDVVQTTWLRLLEHWETIREPCALGAWLRTTARRESLRIMRGGSRMMVMDPTGFEDRRDPAPGLQSRLLTAEAEAALADAIDALPENQRQLMRMLLAEPAPSYADVSRVLSMPIGSIGPTRARALARLRQDDRLAGLLAMEECHD